MTTPTPPEGYRMLKLGEWIRPSVDIYCIGRRWHPIKKLRGKYDPDRYWPIARPIEET